MQIQFKKIKVKKFLLIPFPLLNILPDLDKIIGYRLSPLSKTAVGALSAGRVQSAALKLLVDREKEIQAFVPEQYYNIELTYPCWNHSILVKRNHQNVDYPMYLIIWQSFHLQNKAWL